MSAVNLELPVGTGLLPGLGRSSLSITCDGNTSELIFTLDEEEEGVAASTSMLLGPGLTWKDEEGKTREDNKTNHNNNGKWEKIDRIGMRKD